MYRAPSVGPVEPRRGGEKDHPAGWTPISILCTDHHMKPKGGRHFPLEHSGGAGGKSGGGCKLPGETGAEVNDGGIFICSDR
jgi:hypothetical protein